LVWHIDLLKLLPFFRLPSATRIILFLHGVEVWRELDPGVKLLLRRVNLFLSNSLHTWQTFLRYHSEFKEVSYQIVHLGLGAPDESYSSKPASVPIVLMLARLVRSEDYKGHRELLAAWPEIIARIPRAQLWIAGDGDLRPDLETHVVANNLTKSVTFWGAVSEARKQELLQQSRCLAMPSRAEGFGLVYLEAMRLGRPCLVSTLDAGREVVNPPEAGLACNPANLGEVADSVCRLLDQNNEWSRWSMQARQRYEYLFTAQKFQNRLLANLLPSY
jgi:phosphatidylinositol alpha-1,6-mannosyltransferase